MSKAEIKPIRVGELTAFLEDFLKNRKSGEVVPISHLRARSQEKNPYALPTDIGLLVAYDQGLCVGYLGVLPGSLNYYGTHSTAYFSTTINTQAHIWGFSYFHY